MTNTQVPASDALPNGPGAAAILAAGIGSGALGVFALTNDAFAWANKFFTFYPPTGGLSGVTTTAIVVWLIVWFVLARRWASVNVNMRTISLVSFGLLAVGFLLTFPPVMDLIQGK